MRAESYVGQAVVVLVLDKALVWGFDSSVLEREVLDETMCKRFRERGRSRTRCYSCES
jgi:hypothetical protein